MRLKVGRYVGPRKELEGCLALMRTTRGGNYLCQFHRLDTAPLSHGWHFFFRRHLEVTRYYGRTRSQAHERNAERAWARAWVRANININDEDTNR